MNEELDSQLSAMFDDELPPAECELLARRLSRDEQLKARWGRYAVIGATIRAEGTFQLNSNLARRVSVAISTEPVLAAKPAAQRPGRLATRWWQPVAGVAVAAGVAAVSILWLRSQALPDGSPVMAQTSMSAGVSSLTGTGSVKTATATPRSEADSYVVPQPVERRTFTPGTQLANYVVAHSEFSSPVSRGNLLSAMMASESGTAGASAGSEEPTEDVDDDAKNTQ